MFIVCDILIILFWLIFVDCKFFCLYTVINFLIEKKNAVAALSQSLDTNESDYYDNIYQENDKTGNEYELFYFIYWIWNG